MMNSQLQNSVWFARTREGKVAVRCETHDVELPRKEKQRYARSATVGVSSVVVKNKICPKMLLAICARLRIIFGTREIVNSVDMFIQIMVT